MKKYSLSWTAVGAAKTYASVIQRKESKHVGGMFSQHLCMCVFTLDFSPHFQIQCGWLTGDHLGL